MKPIVNEKFELVVSSRVCVNPNNCFEVETRIPWYVTAILAGSIILIAKEFLPK